MSQKHFSVEFIKKFEDGTCGTMEGSATYLQQDDGAWVKTQYPTRELEKIAPYNLVPSEDPENPRGGPEIFPISVFRQATGLQDVPSGTFITYHYGAVREYSIEYPDPEQGWIEKRYVTEEEKKRRKAFAREQLRVLTEELHYTKAAAQSILHRGGPRFAVQAANWLNKWLETEEKAMKAILSTHENWGMRLGGRTQAEGRISILLNGVLSAPMHCNDFGSTLSLMPEIPDGYPTDTTGERNAFFSAALSAFINRNCRGPFKEPLPEQEIPSVYRGIDKNGNPCIPSR